jgi:thiamine transporter ThiT
VIDLNKVYAQRKREEMMLKQVKDIVSSIIGTVVLYLIWRYWNHTVAGLLLVYCIFRNHGYSHVLLREIFNRKHLVILVIIAYILLVHLHRS